jgi:hypothetical protein
VKFVATKNVGQQIFSPLSFVFVVGSGGSGIRDLGGIRDKHPRSATLEISVSFQGVPAAVLLLLLFVTTAYLFTTPLSLRVWRINYKENVLYVQGNAVQGPVGSLLQICDSKLPVRHWMFTLHRFVAMLIQYMVNSGFCSSPKIMASKIVMKYV